MFEPNLLSTTSVTVFFAYTSSASSCFRQHTIMDDRSVRVHMVIPACSEWIGQGQ